MSFKEIWDALKTKLDELKVDTQPVNEVYNYEKKTTEKYPYVAITPTALVEEVLDQLQNQTTYQFTIRIVDKNTSISTMENRMRIIADQAAVKLREMWHEITLTDGTTVRLTWAANWAWMDEQEPQRVFNIDFSAFAVKDL